MNPKQIIGEKAAEYLKDGMIVGLGSGSTAYWATRKIGELVRNGLMVKGVPTSDETEKLARAEGIPIIDIAEIDQIDVTIDGADEFDPSKNVIKGGGGALLREKIVASLTRFYIIIADASKSSVTLGHYPVPVEVTPFAWQVTGRQLEKLGCKVSARMNNNQLFLTDNKNYILDCNFGKIEQPVELAAAINRIPGVVENGLFLNMAQVLITTNEQNELVIFE
ncbi:MAG: ribose-5-phosphate isomerase RpiA [Prolixibacteraceae bacterium]